MYLASADWMDRNFFRRIEICFPVRDKKLKKRVFEEGLQIYLQDNTQAWQMNEDGHYQIKPARRVVKHCAQLTLLQELAD